MPVHQFWGTPDNGTICRSSAQPFKTENIPTSKRMDLYVWIDSAMVYMKKGSKNCFALKH
jgi:hypothetical protein